MSHAAREATTSRTTHPRVYDELLGSLREAATLGSIESLLGWDQETYMPPAAAAHRANQAGLVAALAHERATSARIGELLTACESDAGVTSDPVMAANLREIRRDYDRHCKLPTDLVAELSRVTSLAQEAWKDARQRSDFAGFAPWLEQVMTLTRRKAQCYGVPAAGELYDALLDEYEPGARAADIESVFKPLGARLAALVKDLTTRGKRPADACLNIPFDPTKQHELGQLVLKAMGFDFASGRLDVTTHPFCSGMAPGDTRLTTRYRDEKFTDALYGTMHEGGHGLYEQGLPKLVPSSNGHISVSSLWGSPLAAAISLGIHESQSRMWENFVGRSAEFWQWLHPIASQLAGPEFAKHAPLDYYRATNTATPSLIRVEADEATYNLHVMLRFDVERGLISGRLNVKDLPGEWNAAVTRYLGITPPDDRRGCLQDVHWSAGLIGYFPTYTLGNLYAAQFWETINREMPDLRAKIARGELLDLKRWLNAKIHQHGRRFLAGDLCRQITGAPLSADPLMRHLEGKLRPIYGV
jgi:carboxypeptidase Taq